MRTSDWVGLSYLGGAASLFLLSVGVLSARRCKDSLEYGVAFFATLLWPLLLLATIPYLIGRMVRRP